jgi:hypothetical protein
VNLAIEGNSEAELLFDNEYRKELTPPRLRVLPYHIKHKAYNLQVVGLAADFA